MIGLIVFLLIVSAVLSTLWDFKLIQRSWKWIKE